MDKCTRIRCHNRAGNANARTEFIKVALEDEELQSGCNRLQISKDS